MMKGLCDDGGGQVKAATLKADTVSTNKENRRTAIAHMIIEIPALHATKVAGCVKKKVVSFFQIKDGEINHSRT